MLLSNPLQYKEIIQKVQQRRDECARGRDADGDAGRDGEFAALLGVDVYEG